MSAEDTAVVESGKLTGREIVPHESSMSMAATYQRAGREFLSSSLVTNWGRWLNRSCVSESKSTAFMADIKLEAGSEVDKTNSWTARAGLKVKEK